MLGRLSTQAGGAGGRMKWEMHVSKSERQQRGASRKTRKAGPTQTKEQHSFSRQRLRLGRAQVGVQVRACQGGQEAPKPHPHTTRHDCNCTRH